MQGGMNASLGVACNPGLDGSSEQGGASREKTQWNWNDEIPATQLRRVSHTSKCIKRQ